MATFTGKTMGGNFVPTNPAEWAKAFCRKDGTPMVVETKRIVPKRSPQANRYWWGVVVAMFAEEMGIRDKEAMHHTLLEHLGHYDLVTVKGREVKVVKPTRELQGDEFAHLIDAAAQLFHEWFNGWMPTPDSLQAKAIMEGA